MQSKHRDAKQLTEDPGLAKARLWLSLAAEATSGTVQRCVTSLHSNSFNSLYKVSAVLHFLVPLLPCILQRYRYLEYQLSQEYIPRKLSRQYSVIIRPMSSSAPLHKTPSRSVGPNYRSEGELPTATVSTEVSLSNVHILPQTPQLIALLR
jgi:hypothetical protein